MGLGVKRMQHVELLSQISDNYQNILQSNLVGIYVHGSIAFGCYHPEKSDIDFLVVVKDNPTLKEKEQMIEVLLKLSDQAPKKGLEMSVVLEGVCTHFIYPTPFELHFSNAHRKRCQDSLRNYCETMNGTDKDLAAHITVIRKVGYVLVGKPINEVFGEVPKKAYLDSLKYDIEGAADEILQNPVDIILNLCRVLGYIADEIVLSKEQGGHWGIEHILTKYAPVIENALVCYQTDQEYEIEKIGKTLVLEFCQYMLRCIFQTEY